MHIHDLIVTHGKEVARTMVSERDRRLVDLAAQILGEEQNDLAYLYSGFAMTTLPHRKPQDEVVVWRRSNGRFSLLVEPGYLIDWNGNPQRYGVPYGARARLIMLYLQSEAICTNSPEIRLGATMHEWLDRMGMTAGGTSYAAIRDQARRISACRLTVGWMAESGKSGFERANIVSAMMFTPPVDDERQGHLWDETARLSSEFYAALREHPVPVSEPAIRLIQNSSAVIDVYIWLCYRLRSITKPTLISWPALHAQFGPEYKQLKKFREKFIDNMKEAMSVYPEARLIMDSRGVTLQPSRPPVPELVRR